MVLSCIYKYLMVLAGIELYLLVLLVFAGICLYLLVLAGTRHVFGCINW